MLNSYNSAFMRCYSPGCLGRLGDANCALGYTGNLCDECVNTGNLSSSYSRSDAHTCSACPSPGDIISTIVKYVLIAIAVFFVLVNSSLQNYKVNAFQVLMKIIISYIQFTSVAALLSFGWPTSLQYFLSGMLSSSNVGSAAFTFDCLVLTLDLPVVVMNAIAFAVFPLIILIIIFLLMGCGYLQAILTESKSSVDASPAAGIIVTSTAY
jgi:hypothetical protein